MKFISLEKSYKQNKILVIKFSEPTFTIQTYLDHHDKHKRSNYLKRHIVNEDWDHVNAGSLSAYLLWGPTTDLNINLINYLDHFNISY